jgi:hypothetical protein
MGKRSEKRVHELFEADTAISVGVENSEYGFAFLLIHIYFVVLARSLKLLKVKSTVSV